MSRIALRGALASAAVFALACGQGEPLDAPNDVSGNYSVAYVDNLRVYINDELVAEVASGEDETVTWNGQSFQISTLCSEEGTVCPAETFWGEVGIEQPWGKEYRLLNFVNLDPELGTPGQRLGGLLEDDATFAMLAGLGVDSNDNCAVLGVGVVTGKFVGATIEEGVIAYGWAAGCRIGDVTIDGTLRLETDFTAARTGDLDLSSVTPAPPIDEEGEEIDPETPDEGERIEGEGEDTGEAPAE